MTVLLTLGLTPKPLLHELQSLSSYIAVTPTQGIWNTLTPTNASIALIAHIIKQDNNILLAQLITFVVVRLSPRYFYYFVSHLSHLSGPIKILIRVSDLQYIHYSTFLKQNMCHLHVFHIKNTPNLGLFQLLFGHC